MTDPADAPAPLPARSAEAQQATAARTRREADSMGAVEVPADALWGAQTQRSLEFFTIGHDLMPREMIEAYALVKQACAEANATQSRLPAAKRDLIARVCGELASGKFNDMFPVHVWMTGSGTQFNMNVNEVIANRASQLSGAPLGSKKPLHPNDDVNMSQSTNDTFPAAMHVATVLAADRHLLPALRALQASLQRKADQWRDVVKVGRTHLQDAVPVTLGQEWEGYAGMLAEHIPRIEAARDGLLALPLGGTALGTGVNTAPGFDRLACAALARLSGGNFTHAGNKFALMGAHDALVAFSAALRGLAASLNKIANDIRLLACGPRAGLGELHLPENEPGSSIMPGKVNPTQAEALTMLCLQVMANDTAVVMGNSAGMLDMNAYKPLMIHNITQSLTLLHDGMENFRKFLVEGTQPDEAHLGAVLDHSLIMVTALSPVIGYDRAAQVAHHALTHHMSPRDSVEALGFMTGEAYDRVAEPRLMLQPNLKACPAKGQGE
ncbi:class II fumarate hydratase [Oecophyllibacter saccharovorans]|nr:class II fumarate hydratase [Oecophyllibacter saccharovorans]